MDILMGWIGEKKASFYLWLSLNNKSYRRFSNIIIPSKNGTSQIDHLIVSIYGLFIVETKNIRGWIFGSEQQYNWTQSIYGKNYSFQNPLKQVYRQKKVLSEFLNVDEFTIHTVVYFAGNCRFKTKLPGNVINFGLGGFIKQFQNQILLAEDVNQVIRTIEKHLSESPFSKSDHITSLRERRSSNTVCPKCGSTLTEIIAKKGDNAGKKFLGCVRYPKCRFTKNI